jgi:hypothetical protein
LTQEDWNVVLFNGMEKTSHWAALYFVALMTFGNYVLFNLLVAILVEGFSAEVRNLLSIDKLHFDAHLFNRTACLGSRLFLLISIEQQKENYNIRQKGKDFC